MDERFMICPMPSARLGFMLLDLSKGSKEDPYESWIGFYTRKRDAKRAAERIEKREAAVGTNCIGPEPHRPDCTTAKHGIEIKGE